MILLSVLSSAMTGAKLGAGAVDLWYGKYGNEVKRGLDFLEDYENSDFENNASLQAAISTLQSIPDDTKDYLIVMRDYFLAIAYAYNTQFSAAYRCIADIGEVETGLFTAKSDTIEDFQESALELLHKIQDMEENYNRTLEESEESEEHKSSNDNTQSNTKWIFLFVTFGLGVILILLGYYLFR